MLIFLKNILQLILAPGKGWEDISAAGTDPEELISRGLYPILGVCSLSVFVQHIYHPELKLTMLIEMALVLFVSFFVTLFFARTMFKSFLYKYVDGGNANEKKYTTVIVYSLSILALIAIFCNLLPVKLTLYYLLPLVVALILWKASLYLAVKSDNEIPYLTLAVFSIILPPILIQELFTLIIF